MSMPQIETTKRIFVKGESMKQKDKHENYEAFVEKFKPKKTTDDCHTPKDIYEEVKTWVQKEFDLKDRPIVRPFYPGGNYETYKYPENCVVIDNPPFSIMSKINRFYIERKIDFFLFAPALTLLSQKKIEINYIVTGTTIEYENGAKVETSFVTSLGDQFIRSAPILKEKLESKKRKPKKAKYKYPNEVTSGALLCGISDEKWSISREECQFVSRLDQQKQDKKTIYGGGLLLSSQKAKEIQRIVSSKQKKYQKWELSEREKEIVKRLDEKQERKK